jgi:peptide-methionine (S)-S-oxide reductase
VISYRELLDIFWNSHSPTSVPYSDQYKSVIFYHDDEQKNLATETRDSLEVVLGQKVLTEIVPAGIFYPAEDYHQKYYLRRVPELVAEFEAIYPDTGEFVASTAVTRANGYAGGYGTPEGFEQELGQLGLSAEGEAVLRETVGRGLTPACPAGCAS